MYQDLRKELALSKECWTCLDVIKDVWYANAYTYFWADRAKLVQQAIRRIAPDIKGDWLRFKFEGMTVTFALSDEAIQRYRPKIQEFSSFGSAVRMLGAYEDYVRRVVDLSYQAIPGSMSTFKANHKKHITKKNESFIKAEVGRGIDFFEEVFNYKQQPPYRPALEFIFQLRNVAVHNSGRADQRLLDAANDPHVNVKETLTVGDRVEWTLSLSLQLHHLLTSLLPEVDPFISNVLNLSTVKRQAFWYSESEK